MSPHSESTNLHLSVRERLWRWLATHRERRAKQQATPTARERSEAVAIILIATDRFDDMRAGDFRALCDRIVEVLA